MSPLCDFLELDQARFIVVSLECPGLFSRNTFYANIVCVLAAHRDGSAWPHLHLPVKPVFQESCHHDPGSFPICLQNSFLKLLEARWLWSLFPPASRTGPGTEPCRHRENGEHPTGQCAGLPGSAAGGGRRWLG